MLNRVWPMKSLKNMKIQIIIHLLVLTFFKKHFVSVFYWFHNGINGCLFLIIFKLFVFIYIIILKKIWMLLTFGYYLLQLFEAIFWKIEIVLLFAICYVKFLIGLLYLRIFTLSFEVKTFALNYIFIVLHEFRWFKWTFILF